MIPNPDHTSGRRSDRLQKLSFDELNLIHHASIKILNQTGVNFNDPAIARRFETQGFKTKGTIVFFTKQQIETALTTTPSEFTLHARNPDYNITIGNDKFALLPTGGAPNVVEPDGSQRPASLDDFEKCCKLVQTSDQLDMGGYVMVQPTDVAPEVSHLDMMLAYMTLCDKPIFGASSSGRAARDTIEMAGILFGGKDKLKKKPVMASVVNAMSPLQYSKEQADVIVEMAQFNQPVVLANMILAGASGPISLPSLIAMGNAELLAGITLSQLISPGTPVVYGSTSAPMDMRTMVSAVGAPETVKLASTTIQLANFYNLPCRTGGGLTDAHITDAQALSESALMLSTVIRNGANFIYHSCGQMGSFIGMSFEKWLIDEEVCRNVRQLIEPIEITKKSIDIQTIHEIGIGGQYLSHPTTFEQFRALSYPKIFNRKDHSKWQADGSKSIDQTASEMLDQRLSEYETPVIDPILEHRLLAFVKTKKANA